MQRSGYAKRHAHNVYLRLIIYIINKQATSKIWSLYTFDGFLPSSYIRDLVKITKVTDIKQGILEEYIWI